MAFVGDQVHVFTAPFFEDSIGKRVSDGFLVRPFKNFRALRGVGAESHGIWSDKNAAQIESIGVPTSLDGQVSLGQALRMVRAGNHEQF